MRPNWNFLDPWICGMSSAKMARLMSRRTPSQWLNIETGQSCYKGALLLQDVCKSWPCDLSHGFALAADHLALWCLQCVNWSLIILRLSSRTMIIQPKLGSGILPLTWVCSWVAHSIENLWLDLKKTVAAEKPKIYVNI